jgi:hypothetical protein
MPSESLRTAIAVALDRKKVPPFLPGLIRDLATKLGLGFPVSIAALIRALANLPPAVVTINIEEAQTPGGFWASGQIGLQSDGAVSFRGTVNTPGPGGYNYLYSVALLDVTDESGRVLAFADSGNLFNAIQSSSTSFQQDGYSQYVAQHWDTAKRTRYYADVSDSDNVWENLAAGVLEALAVVATAGIVLFIPGGGGPYQRPSCMWIGAGTAGNPSQGNFSGCVNQP